MKKILVVFLALIVCLSLVSCGKNEAYIVAEKLDGTWTAVWDSALGEMANIYTFEYSGQDAGSCEFYNVMNGSVIVNYKVGVFEVRDGIITMDFRALSDKQGNIQELDSIRTLILSYVYEDGEVVVKDGDRQFFQTEK